MESLAKVRRVFVKMHECAVERLVNFVWRGEASVSSTFSQTNEMTKGPYRNNPTA